MNIRRFGFGTFGALGMVFVLLLDKAFHPHQSVGPITMESTVDSIGQIVIGALWLGLLMMGGIGVMLVDILEELRKRRP
ncbi:MAG TPA: hypothetical protein VHV55_28005 [Pirellulales bacterium]|jgi:hypothetical protein|nr:hypothetical protein [Pirellulales bacterium]